MKIKKGQLVFVKHSRSGNWHGIAEENFDTDKDEWYPLKLAEVSREGLNTQWLKGESMPARRGLCQVELVTEKKKSKLTTKDFAKDHWSLFAYVETRCVDYSGKLDPAHLRCNTNIHSEKQTTHISWDNKYSTCLFGGERVIGHDDWDVLKDLEDAGLIKIIPTLENTVELTEKGFEVIALLRRHKCKGDSFGEFKWVVHN